MAISVEQIDQTSAKVTITVEPGDVNTSLRNVATAMAKQMKIPGFRPGKAPVKVIESRLGKGAVAQEAAQTAFNRHWPEAAEQLERRPVGHPSLDIEQFEKDKEGVLVATVDTLPEVEIPDYVDMTIEHPEWELTDEDLNDHIDNLRERFAELETVDRAAERGDYVVVSAKATFDDGTEVEDAKAEDQLYQIPENETESPLDEALIGVSAGETVTFDDTVGNEEGGEDHLNYTAEVKEVKTQILPEFDDEFALTASEFDTAEELRADLQNMLSTEKKKQAKGQLRGAVIEAIADLVEIPVPESLVAEELNFRLSSLAQQAEQYGLELAQFIALTGHNPDEIVDEYRVEAEKTVKAQLIVDEIGQREEIKVEQSDLGYELARQAHRLGRDPQELADVMMKNDNVQALYADTYRRKTIDHIMGQVTITNAPPEDPEDVSAVSADGGEEE